jgi:hypothetical protein
MRQIVVRNQSQTKNAQKHVLASAEASAESAFCRSSLMIQVFECAPTTNASEEHAHRVTDENSSSRLNPRHKQHDDVLGGVIAGYRWGSEPPRHRQQR